jgi:hypothetical protein
MEDEQFILLDVPEISWDVLQEPVEQPTDKFWDVFELPQDTTTATLSVDTSASPEAEGLSPLHGVLLCLFVLLVLSFLAAQIVVYYKYWSKKKRGTIPRLSRRFRQTKTITFQSKRPVVRAHVYDPTHHIPPSRPYRQTRTRRISNASEATHGGHSTAGSQSRSSFSSTVFMLDSKSNYTAKMSVSPEITLDVESESGSQWSDGTMGKYSLSSSFFPCENPAFETDSTTSASSTVSSAKSMNSLESSSSSGSSALYRPPYRARLPSGVVKRLHSGHTSSTSSSSSAGGEVYRGRRVAVRGSYSGAVARGADSSFTSVSSMSALSSFRFRKKPGRHRVKWARHS